MTDPSTLNFRQAQARGIMRSAYREAVKLIAGRPDETAQDIINMDCLDELVVHCIVPVNADNALAQTEPRWIVGPRQVEEIARAAALGAIEATKASEAEKSGQAAPDPEPTSGEETDQIDRVPQFVRGDPEVAPVEVTAVADEFARAA